jgi:RNA polymerase sigma-70 factor (ECF subfamily)
METDLDLLQAARKMDQDALVKIFDLYAVPLYRYALRLCGDRLLSDQIVGDVFAKLLEELTAGKGPTTNLRSYLYQMAHHQTMDEARYALRRAPLEALHALLPDVPSGGQDVENRILFEKVLTALQRDLTGDQRHVIMLRFLEGFNLRETAAILGKEAGHIRVIQTRALAKLRKVLSPKEVQPARQTGHAFARGSPIAKGSEF